MLHMVYFSHNPESCAIGNKESRRKALTQAPKLPALAEKHGISIQGAWVNKAAHAHYILVDAPNAHVVDDFIVESEFSTWNTFPTVQSVITMDEAVASLPRD